MKGLMFSIIAQQHLIIDKMFPVQLIHVWYVGLSAVEYHVLAKIQTMHSPRLAIKVGCEFLQSRNVCWHGEWTWKVVFPQRLVDTITIMTTTTQYWVSCAWDLTLLVFHLSRCVNVMWAKALVTKLNSWIIVSCCATASGTHFGR